MSLSGPTMVCIDFCKLSMVTVFDAELIFDTEDIVLLLSQARLFFR